MLSVCLTLLDLGNLAERTVEVKRKLSQKNEILHCCELLLVAKVSGITFGAVHLTSNSFSVL